MRCTRKSGGALAALVGAAMAVSPAHAEVIVEGEPDAVHLEVHQSSLRQVLDAMQARFGLRYKTADALERPITGTFDGPLRRVAARLLDGYDFAMKVTPGGIDLLVLQQNRRGPMVAALQQPAQPARPRPMTAQEANRRARGLSH